MRPNMVIAVAIGIPLLMGIFWTAFVVFRRKEAAYLLPVWSFVIGLAAPFVPPTIEEVTMRCPPPSTGCGVVGSAPWPVLVACLVGFALSVYPISSEPTASKPANAERGLIAERLKGLGATLALAVGVLFASLHYYLRARELKDAISNTIAAEQARAAGRILVTDIVGGPSEAWTVFIGLVVTLTVGAASFKGSLRWQTFLWPFVLGLIWFPLTGAIDSIGSFGWAYRNFVERYVWFLLLALCCVGFLTSQFAKSSVNPSEKPYLKKDRNLPKPV